MAGLVGGIIWILDSAQGPPAPGAELVKREKQLATTIETWKLKDGTPVRFSVDGNGKRTPK